MGDQRIVGGIRIKGLFNTQVTLRGGQKTKVRDGGSADSRGDQRIGKTCKCLPDWRTRVAAVTVDSKKRKARANDVKTTATVRHP